MVYERLCSISERIPVFSSLGRRRDDKELDKAVRYLSPRMELSSFGVVAAAYLCSTLSIVILLSLLVFLTANLLVALVLSILNAIVIYYAVIMYPVNLMNRDKLMLSEEADLVFEQFILVFQSGGTIFDAIEMVAQSEHPMLSSSFRQMLSKIEKGVPPEKCLSDFAKSQPSDDLRRYIISIISSLETKTDMLEMLSGESFEADLALRQKNLELESRLLIVSALTTYAPIMFTLAAALAGFATNILVILLAPVLIIMNALLKSRFTNQFSAYFDRPREDGIGAPTQKEIIEEYDEFLNFLILIGERLQNGDTLEVGLLEVRDELEPEVQRIVDKALHAIYDKNLDLEEAMSIAAKSTLGRRASSLMNILTRMCLVSATDAGERITRIAARLVKRSAVAKERDTIIAAQKMKVYLLCITSSIVLGLLSSLAPFLAIGTLLSGGPGSSFQSVGVLEILPLILTLGITALSTGYQNTKMVGGGRPVMISVICGLLYALSFLLSSSFLGLGVE